MLLLNYSTHSHLSITCKFTSIAIFVLSSAPQVQNNNNKMPNQPQDDMTSLVRGFQSMSGQTSNENRWCPLPEDPNAMMAMGGLSPNNGVDTSVMPSATLSVQDLTDKFGLKTVTVSVLASGRIHWKLASPDARVHISHLGNSVYSCLVADSQADRVVTALGTYVCKYSRIPDDTELESKLAEELTHVPIMQNIFESTSKQSQDTCIPTGITTSTDLKTDFNTTLATYTYPIKICSNGREQLSTSLWVEIDWNGRLLQDDMQGHTRDFLEPEYPDIPEPRVEELPDDLMID